MQTDEIALRFKDKQKRVVVWYKESYEWHINHKHVDVKRCQNLIPKALKTPDFIYEDNRRKSTTYYVLLRKNRKSVSFYLKVVVNYAEVPARVKTAFQDSKIEKGAKIVY